MLKPPFLWVRLQIVLSLVSASTLWAAEQQPNLIASLLPFVLLGLIVFLIVTRRRKGKKYVPTQSDIYRQRPPTERQIAFIDVLMQEREVEIWMLEKEPETIQQASELIEKLKKLPIRRT